jgi:hypothetical protein
MAGEKKDAKDGKLDDFNNTLLNVENRLLYRALDRARDDAERGYDFVNKAVEAGVAEIDCEGCDDDDAGGEVAGDVNDSSGSNDE